MDIREKRKYLIECLTDENVEYGKLQIPEDDNGQKMLLRGLMNARPPREIGSEFLKVQDEYLSECIKANGIVSLSDLSPINEKYENFYVWKGDITRLAVGAIVNAANSRMTGCYQPNHKCIDNCIHTFAGVQLRLECSKLIEKQGYPEETGGAKLTEGYNLPCDYIIHTVGPIIYGEISPYDDELLASCYRNCMRIAEENHIKSIAFCCISTGVFHFPNERAAEIAVKTVRDYIKERSSNIKVIFNVFKEMDYEIYRELLRK